MMGELLSLDAILKCSDLEEKVIEVPEWGGSVKIRGFSKAKQQQMRKEATIGGQVDTDRMEMLMFIHGVIDPQFTEQNYEQLREKSAAAIDRVLREIMASSGLNEEAVKAAEKLFRPGNQES